MSNALAVPAVTAALTTIVQAAVDGCGLSPRPVVTPGPLGNSGEGPFVVVHLHRITHDPSLAVKSLPTRPGGGDPPQQPRVALNLHYLISFCGNTDWDAQQLLAATAAMLHVVPVLTAPQFVDAEAAHPQIAGNDLSAAEEPVRVAPDTLSIDELNGVWALYPPGSFAVTLAVSAGPVLIDGNPEEG